MSASDEGRRRSPTCSECGGELDAIERRAPWVCFVCAIELRRMRGVCRWCRRRHRLGDPCPERGALDH